MESSNQQQTTPSKGDLRPTHSDFDRFGGEFGAPIEDGDMLLRSGQDNYTPKQVLQLQRVLGNQATIQLVRKVDSKPRDFTKLKMVQRDTQSGGLPPPPPENDSQSGGLPPPPQYDDEKEDSNDPPPFMSEVTGQGGPNFEISNDEKQESTLKEFNGITDPVTYAHKALKKYRAHLQNNPNDTTFTQNWHDWEVEQVAEGWANMKEDDQKSYQHVVSQLVLEDQRIEYAVSAKQFEQSDETVGKISEGLETGLNVSAVTGAGFSVGTGVDIAVKLKDGIGTLLTTSASAFEKIVSTIIGFVWLPLLIGYEAIRAFHYHKRRRDGYKSRMDSLEGKDKKDKDESKLYEISKYAYKKTKRAFNTSMAKIALRIVRMISLVVTVLTGGTSASITGAIAAITAVVESTETLYRKIKGLGKIIMGSRGKNREKNAEELVKLAKNGNEDAAQTILDVNPFDEFTMRQFRKLSNKVAPTLLGGSSINPITNSREIMQGLEKPQDAQTLIFMLQNRPENGGWTAEHETMLERSLANTMVSQ